MNSLEELRQAAQDVINRNGECIVLVISRVSRGNSIRMFGKRGPIGDVLCVNSDGKSVARFKAASVIKYLDGLNDNGK